MTDKLATATQLAPGWTEDQRKLIKRTVAPNSTDDELAMFLHVARVSGLDPLQKQIWFSKRGDRVIIQAGVDGLQARALEMGDCEGIQSAAVYQKDDFVFDMRNGEVVKHVGNPFADRGVLIGAWGIVIRKGLRPFYALVRYSEYNDTNSPIWRAKPAVMIEKVARSTALRRAYPKNFGGIYDPSELGKEAVHQPEEGVLDHPAELPSHKRETEKFEESQSAPPPDNTQRAAEAVLDASEEAEELRARAEAEADAAEDPILAKIAASKTVRDLMVVFKGVKDRTPYMEAWNAAAERIADGKQPLPAKKG